MGIVFSGWTSAGLRNLDSVECKKLRVKRKRQSNTGEGEKTFIPTQT